MKKKIKIIVLSVLIIAILFVPFTFYNKDGGTVEHRALTYAVINRHSIAGEDVYDVGTEVEILGIKVYDNTQLVYDHKAKHSTFCESRGF